MRWMNIVKKFVIPSISKKGEIKLPQINKDVSAVDKMSIYMQTGKKMFRGLLKKPLKKLVEYYL